MKTRKYGIYDSEEEQNFACWLSEGAEHGLIEAFECHETTFTLADKKSAMNNGKSKFLFHPMTYKPDFIFTVTPKFKQAFPKLKWFFGNGDMIYAEIKGGWVRGDETKALNITRKWLYQSQNVYVEVIKIGGKGAKNDLFLQTWCPMTALITPKTRKVRKKYEGAKIIGDFA